MHVWKTAAVFVTVWFVLLFNTLCLSAETPVAFVVNTDRDPDSAPEPQPALGRLVLRDSQGREAQAMEVRQLRMKITVRGPVALTEIEQTFFNPTTRRTEGVFYFPIPAGASLCRFAMYVGDTLVEAEPVERNRARAVYEEIVRKMQDPALMEWQEGNVFKTRIFPIEARGLKRVLISFTQPLAALNGLRTYTYPLLSKTTQVSEIGKFEVEAELHGAAASPGVIAPQYEDATISVDKNKDATILRLKRENFIPEHDLVLKISSAGEKAWSLYTDRRAGEDGFFLLSFAAPEIKNPEPIMRRPTVYLLDTSLSRRADDFKAQINLLRVLVHPGKQPNDPVATPFAVMGFDVAASVIAPRGIDAKGFPRTNAEAREVLDAAEKIVPLGATNLEAAITGLDRLLSEHPEIKAPDVVFIGDGIATLGETAPEKLTAKILPVLEKHHARFHAVVMGAQQDRTVLRELTRRTDGLFRALTPGDGVAHEAAEFSRLLASPLCALPEIKLEGVPVKDLYYSHQGALVVGEETFVFGRYEKAGKLSISIAAKGAEALKAEAELPETDNRNVFIPRLWARERLDMLMLQPQTSEIVKAICDLSYEYSMITPYTSFLVLENEAAYQQYGVNRKKRRKFWEESGTLRSAPPPDAVVPQAPASPVNIAQDKEPVLPAMFKLENMDLARLATGSQNGRVISSALSSLCLEVYYRYLPISNNGGGQLNAAAGNDLVIAAETITRPEDFAVRKYNALADAPDTTEKRMMLVVPEVQAKAELTDHFEIVNRGRPDIDGGVRFIPSLARNETGVSGFNGSTLDDLIGVSGSPGSGGGWGGGDGTGTGNDSGNGHGSFGQRGGGGRKLLVARHGGSRATESGVETTLYWLAASQREDGSWGGGSVEEVALSLLAYLAAGHTEKVGKYKTNVRQAVGWLRQRQQNDGSIGNGTYDQALAVAALAEAAGMGRIPTTLESAQKALESLCARQLGKPDAKAGWADTGTEADPLTTYFCILALKSSKVAGLSIPMEAFDGAIKYLDQIQNEAGVVGAKGRPEKNEIDLLNTAGAVLSRQFTGWSAVDLNPSANIIFNQIFKLHQGKMLNTPDAMYVRYFATLVMFQQGGELWKAWNEWNKSNLIEGQVKEGADKGSWEPHGIWIRGRTPERIKDEVLHERITKALEEVKRAPHNLVACGQLINALAPCLDARILESYLSEALPDTAKSLLTLKRAQLYEGAGKFDDAASLYRSVYENQGHPTIILNALIQCRLANGQHKVALDYLVGELNASVMDLTILKLFVDVLYTPGAQAGDTAAYVARKLSGKAENWIDLYRLCSRRALNLKRYDEAARLSTMAYEASTRDEEDLNDHLVMLKGAKCSEQALELLARLAKTDRLVTHAFVNQVMNFLMDAEPDFGQVLNRIDADFAVNKQLAHVLRLKMGQLALAREKPSLALPLLERVWDEGSSTTEATDSLAQAYLALEKKEAVFDLYLREIQSRQRISSTGLYRLSTLITDRPEFKTNPLGFFKLILPDDSRTDEIRSNLEVAVANPMFASNNSAYRKTATLLMQDAYLNGGRISIAFEPCIQALLTGGKFEIAARELERAIQTGYHTPWAFGSLQRAYTGLGLNGTQLLRAISSEVELFPKEAQPHLNLAAYFETHGETDAALEQYQAVVRSQGGDAYHHRQLIERALAANRFDIALAGFETMSKQFLDLAQAWGNDAGELLTLLRKQSPQAPLSDVKTRQEFEKQVRELAKKDLVAILSWDTNATDVDLHVTDPSGEECFYSHKITQAGGVLDHDVTTGLGPETFAIRKAMPGKYKVEAVYYSGNVPTNLTVRVYTKRGSPNEKVRLYSAEVRKQGEKVLLTEVSAE